MKVLVSGTAGVGVSLGSRPQLFAPGRPPKAAWHNQDILRVFDGCDDVFATTIDPEGLASVIRQATQNDLAVRLFLHLLAASEDDSDADLREYAECIEELFEDNPGSVQFVVDRILAAPFPNNANPERGLRASTGAGTVHSLLDRAVASQTRIREVCERFTEAYGAAAADLEPELEVKATLVAAGAFSSIVLALEQGTSLDFLRLTLTNRHRSLTSLIAIWTASLQSGLKKVRRQVHRKGEPEESDFVHSGPNARTGDDPAFFAAVRVQQRAIDDKLKHGDLAGAKSYARDLIRSQSGNSTADQIAKSLCALSKKAQLHDFATLQLEWATLAVDVDPGDPWTHGHQFDALVSHGKFYEAGLALDRIESLGDMVYANNGRAKILRFNGRLVEARALYLQSATSGLPEHEYGYLGAAECLRDQGDYEGALSELSKLATVWHDDAVWGSIAQTLVEMGRLDEAIATYSKVNRTAAGSLNAQVGSARANFLRGNLKEAIEGYRLTAEQYPSNQAALCGLAQVYRAMGDTDEAIRFYDQALKSPSSSALSYTSKAELLVEMKRFDEALDLFCAGLELFPNNMWLARGHVLILKAQGRYADALGRTEELIEKFPHEFRLQLLRATLLRLLGQKEWALALLNDLNSEYPHRSDIAMSKASLLMGLGRLEEVSKLLPDSAPRSQQDWRRYMLHAVFLQLSGHVERAMRRLEQGATICPFYYDKVLLKSALAALSLRERRWRAARALVEDTSVEVSNVIAFHVLAATHRLGRARERLEAILDSGEPAEVIDLANEIARRHSIIQGPTSHGDAWIRARETDYLLQQAA